MTVGITTTAIIGAGINTMGDMVTADMDTTIMTMTGTSTTVMEAMPTDTAAILRTWCVTTTAMTAVQCH
jgi:hypothetical protein